MFMKIKGLIKVETMPKVKGAKTLARAQKIPANCLNLTSSLSCSFLGVVKTVGVPFIPKFLASTNWKFANKQTFLCLMKLDRTCQGLSEPPLLLEIFF